jgi:hypothetical protein
LEFIENLLKRLVDNISKNIHATSVGHTNDYFCDTSFDQCVKGDLESWDEGLTPLDTKALCGAKFIC